VLAQALQIKSSVIVKHKVLLYADIWMSSAVPASQNFEEAGVGSHNAHSLTTSNSTALEVGNWTPSFLGSTANFGEGTTFVSNITAASLMGDDADRRSPFVWHESMEPPSDVARLLQGLNSSTSAAAAGSKTKPTVRRVSAESLPYNSASGPDSARLPPQPEVFDPRTRTFRPAVGSADTSNSGTAGLSATKRRSLDSSPAERHTANSRAAAAPLPKQRAKSLHALSQKSAAECGDGNGNVGGDGGFRFVAPRQRTQQSSNSASARVSGRMAGVEMNVDKPSVAVDKLPPSRGASDALKHVTLTDPQVYVIESLIDQFPNLCTYAYHNVLGCGKL